MKRTFSLLAAALFAFGSAAQAEGIRPLLSFGITDGGDNLLSVVSTTGTDEITAGGLLFASGGLGFPVSRNVEGRISVGYFFDGRTYINGDASFDRIPLEGLLMFRASNHFILGGGFSYHINPTLSCEITSVCNEDVEFDNAAGLTLQLEWLIGDYRSFSTGLGLRYTDIEYTTPADEAVDGSHAGLIATMRF